MRVRFRPDCACDDWIAIALSEMRVWRRKKRRKERLHGAPKTLCIYFGRHDGYVRLGEA